ncbi:reverse transcriptase domain-containing protein [Rhodococcus sp. NPDC059968]|uniref:reverse transcriptase domain-containing protein n=1 Tax=Rhodococcus sp. NPDC059968 TaxID=3347017 RepID=UPI00367358BD
MVALALEPRTESIFHDDSYGYRPERGALDAVAKCRERCWQKAWVIDLDVSKFFDSVDHDLMAKAVAANTTHEQRWIVLYVRRWMVAPILMPDGRLVERDRGTPQGSAVTPPTQWAMFALRVGVVGVVAGAFADGDAVADGNLVWSDQDVLDQQPQDALAFFDGGDLGFVAELGEESFEVGGEREVGVAVGELAVECIYLVTQVRFSCA